MKIKILILLTFLLTGSAFAQPKILKRTTEDTKKLKFGMGSTLTIVGAPLGNIQIEGWNKNEIEITSNIEVQAENEADLELLFKINGLITDASPNHIRLLSVGAHDKEYLKRTKKKLPKKMNLLPWRIDFKIKVPLICDLEINGGRGDLKISGVEGAMQLKALETNADLNFTGGTVNAVFGAGTVNVGINTRSWRGRHADLQLALGTMNVKILPTISADINASILRSGKIQNLFTMLKPRDGIEFTERSIAARAGNGGATLSFTVGDGNLNIEN